MLHFSIASISNAQNGSVNVLTTATPFLRISPDTRAGGMGDQYIATSPDANSIFGNQSKIAFSPKKLEFAFNYLPWLSKLGFNDVKMLAVASYYKIDSKQAFTSSFRYFTLGSIPLSDELGNQLSTIYPQEYSIDFGYTSKLSARLSLGVALRYIHSKLATGIANDGTTYKAGNSISGDVSLFYNKIEKDGISFGAILSNVGSKIRYQNDPSKGNYLPANLGIGFVYKKQLLNNTSLSFGIDVNKLLVPIAPTLTGNSSIDSVQYTQYRKTDLLSSYFNSFNDGSGLVKSFQISTGLEFEYDNTFFARTGYFYEPQKIGDRRYFSVGSGIKYNQISLNLAYLFPTGNSINFSPLTNTLRIGILYSFSKTED